MSSVIIVGAGPVGLSLALILASQNVHVRILEAKLTRDIGSKAFGVWPRTLELLDSLDDLNLGKTFLKAGVELTKVTIRMNNLQGKSLEIPTVPGKRPLLLSQAVQEQLLESTLKDHYGVEVERGVRVKHVQQEKGASAVTIQTTSIANTDKITSLEAQYVVGCEGSRSSVRDAIGCPFEGKQVGGAWVLIDCKFEGSDEELLKTGPWEGPLLMLHPQGIVGRLPLSKDKRTHRFVAYCRDKTDPAEAKMSPTEIMNILESRYGISLQHWKPVWHSTFSDVFRLAKVYRCRSIFLAGDAAHIHSPVGGQGLNMGIQDSFNLGWKLAAVMRGANEEILDTYESERRPVAINTLKYTRNLSSVVKNVPSVIPWIYSLGLKLQPIRWLMAQAFDASLTQMRLQYQPSVALPSYPPDSGAKGKSQFLGCRFPDVTCEEGKVMPLLHEWSLILVDGTAQDELNTRLCNDIRTFAWNESIFGHLGLRRIVFSSACLASSESNNSVYMYLPADTVAARALLVGNAQTALYLVRPDRHVAFRSSPANLTRLQLATAQLGPA